MCACGWLITGHHYGQTAGNIKLVFGIGATLGQG